MAPLPLKHFNNLEFLPGEEPDLSEEVVVGQPLASFGDKVDIPQD